MSKPPYMEPLNTERSIDIWRNIHAKSIATMSPAAIMYFAQDAQKDIALLYGNVKRLEAALAEAERQRDALEALLHKAEPLVAEREYLETKEFSYGGSWPEPSPAEWGINIGYQQSSEMMPGRMFDVDVKEFHDTNLQEDDGEGKFLTLANKIRQALAALKKDNPA